MGSPSIEEALTAAERALESGRGLAGTGFWQAVSSAKRHPELAERYGGRIAGIDDLAHRRWALLTVPLGVGTGIMVLATLAGLGAISWAYSLDGLGAVAVFYLGFGSLLVTTHGLAHLVVGRLLGIRFTSWFIGSLTRPQPGVKLDYATYLTCRAKSRAWMHASGAIATKTIPFLLVGAAAAAGLPTWAVWGLPVIGLASIVTDVLWSTGSSDWKKFRRERAFAQES